MKDRIAVVSPDFKHCYLNNFKKAESNLNSDLNFFSDKKKIRINASRNYYHFIYDFIGHVLIIIDENKNEEIEIIVDLIEYDENSDKLILFLKDFFERINFKNYFFIKREDSVSIGDHYYLSSEPPELSMHNKIYETFLKAFPSDLQKPEKMVFVSRRSEYGTERIDDSKKIEDFFESLGFEIFLEKEIGDKDLIDVIKYFRGVKIIAGISGAGLANSILMQPGQTVLEIAVPQIIHIPFYESFFPEIYQMVRHTFTPFISFIKDHNYIQIAVSDNSAETAINKINSLGFFK